VNENIAFIDLKTQRRRLGECIDRAVLRVIDHGGYILGPEVAELEQRLAAFCGARHCISCASGTDALLLVLMASGTGPGDAVFVPAFTFVAPAEAAALVGATPIFVDVLPDSFNMDPMSLQAAIVSGSRLGLTPRIVIPVDLFGQPADYRQINEIAKENGLFVLADGAHSFGAGLAGVPVGVLADATATSFFPAKPLGCYGDGGAVFTDDDELASLVRSIRVHGQGTDKYDNARLGLNSRLDTIQAAILLEKLGVFTEELHSRQRVAERYNDALAAVAQVPSIISGVKCVWAQYTLVVRSRNDVITACQAAGIPTAVYYRKPLTQHAGYARFPTVPAGAPVSEHLCQNVISLPMHPYLEESVQDYIMSVVRSALSLD